MFFLINTNLLNGPFGADSEKIDARFVSIKFGCFFVYFVLFPFTLLILKLSFTALTVPKYFVTLYLSCQH